MKKGKILLVALIMLLMTGCFLDKPEKIIEKAALKMGKLDNYHMTMKLNMKMEMSGSSVTFGVNGSMDADEKNKTGYTEMTSSLFGTSETVKSYTKEKDGKTFNYTEEDGSWYVKEEKTQDFSNIDLLKPNGEIKEVSKDNGTYVYEFQLNKEAAKAFFESLNNTEQDDNSFEEVFKGVNYDSIVVRMTINKDKYVSSVSMNIPIAVEDYIFEMSIEIGFSKFNEVGDVTIPQNIIDSASDKTVADLKQNAIDYVDEVEWDVWGDEELENSLYTNTKLEYDGKEPTKVELQLVDGYVTDGIIEIDGYRATFKDGEITSFVSMKSSL